MRDSVADVGQLYNVTKHKHFHGRGQKCGRRTGPSPKFRNFFTATLFRTGLTPFLHF